MRCKQGSKFHLNKWWIGATHRFSQRNKDGVLGKKTKMKIYPQQKLWTEEMNTCFVKIVEDEGMKTHKTNVHIRQLVLLLLAIG